jgi:ATP-dependent Clp protease ATP-binding subunit ClpA
VPMGPFDRFNDRAKRVLALAQDEAIRFKHNYIGVEHLLLGLVREGEGVAARVLDSFGVELSKVRTAVEFVIGRGDATTSPSEITLSPRTKKVIELAIDESRKLGHGAVGTEHLLLGILREGASIASGVIESLGVDAEKIRQQVFATLGQPAPPISHETSYRYVGRELPRPPELLDDITRRVVALAENEAIGLGHTWVGTEHLVLGLIAANGSIPQRVLTELGLTIDRVREQVKQLPPPSAEWQTRDLTMTPRAKQLLERTAQRSGGGKVRAEVLLVNIVRDSDGSGASVLDALKVTESMVRTALGKQQPPPPSC